MAAIFKIRREDWARCRAEAGIRVSGRGDAAADGGDADAGWHRDGGRFDDKAGNAGPEVLAPAEGRVSFRVVWPAAGRLAGAGRRT